MTLRGGSLGRQEGKDFGKLKGGICHPAYTLNLLAVRALCKGLPWL